MALASSSLSKLFAMANVTVGKVAPYIGWMQHAIALSVAYMHNWDMPSLPNAWMLLYGVNQHDGRIEMLTSPWKSTFALKFNLSDRLVNTSHAPLYRAKIYRILEGASCMNSAPCCVWTGFFGTVSTSWLMLTNLIGVVCRNKRCRNRFYYVPIVKKIHVFVRV